MVGGSSGDFTSPQITQYPSLMKLLRAGAIVLAFFAAAFQVEAAFYLRPTLQMVDFTDNEIDTDVGYGGGVALGAAFGKKQQYEAGAEITVSRSDTHSYTYRDYSGAVTTSPMHGKLEVDTCLATFRYSFNERDAAFRPYIDLLFGVSSVNPPVTDGMDVDGGLALRGGAGGGISWKLGRLTHLQFGYRYLFSGEVGGQISFGANSRPTVVTDFRPTSHIVTLAVDQRF